MTIETPRLTLEPVDERHLPDLQAAVEASLDELKPWMAWAEDWEPSESEEYLLNRPENDHIYIICREGRAIGVVNVLVAKPLLGWGELGYWLATPQAGNGYMTEALGAFVVWCFDELGLHRVELRAGVDNAPSNRVAEKLGFDHRGTTRETARGADGFYDCNLWELLATDDRSKLTV